MPDMARNFAFAALRAGIMTRRCNSREPAAKNMLNAALTAACAKLARCSPPHAYDQGLKLSSQGRHVEAICLFEQALAAAARRYRGAVRPGQYRPRPGPGRSRPQQFFRQVLALEPGRHGGHRQSGQSAARRTASSTPPSPCWSRPWRASPHSPELHLTLGSAWREKGDNARAPMHYQAALAASPNYAPALANLADLLAR